MPRAFLIKKQKKATDKEDSENLMMDTDAAITSSSSLTERNSTQGKDAIVKGSSDASLCDSAPSGTGPTPAPVIKPHPWDLHAPCHWINPQQHPIRSPHPLCGRNRSLEILREEKLIKETPPFILNNLPNLEQVRDVHHPYWAYSLYRMGIIGTPSLSPPINQVSHSVGPMIQPRYSPPIGTVSHSPNQLTSRASPPVDYISHSPNHLPPRSSQPSNYDTHSPSHVTSRASPPVDYVSHSPRSHSVPRSSGAINYVSHSPNDVTSKMSPQPNQAMYPHPPTSMAFSNLSYPIMGSTPYRSPVSVKEEPVAPSIKQEPPQTDCPSPQTPRPQISFRPYLDEIIDKKALKRQRTSDPIVTPPIVKTVKHSWPYVPETENMPLELVSQFNLSDESKTKNKVGPPPRFHCDGCGKSYSTFNGLSKHKEFHCATHVKKEFSCKYCDRTYNTLGALKMHIRTHTLPCKCQVCGKAFSRPWLLQGHIRTHTGEKPFKCQHCARAFADRSNLRAHLQTHSDIKKYSCKSCSKTFSRMSLLLKHRESTCMGLVC